MSPVSSCVSNGSYSTEPAVDSSYEMHGLGGETPKQGKEKAAGKTKLVVEVAAKAKTADPFSGLAQQL